MTTGNSKTVRAPSTEATIHSPAIVGVDMGDVTAVPEAPILTPPEGHEVTDQGSDVIYNHSRATQPHGQRCISLYGGMQNLTPLEAARVGRDLIELAKVAADERQLRGFDE